MKLGVQFLSLLLAVGVQLAAWPQVIHRALPAVVLVWAVTWALRSDSWLESITLAFAGGMLLDLYAQRQTGLLTVAVVAGVVAARVLRPPGFTPPIGVRLGALLVASVIYHLVLLLYLQLFTPQFPFLATLFQVATLDVIATVLVFIGLEAGMALVSIRNVR